MFLTSCVSVDTDVNVIKVLAFNGLKVLAFDGLGVGSLSSRRVDGGRAQMPGA